MILPPLCVGVTVVRLGWARGICFEKLLSSKAWGTWATLRALRALQAVKLAPLLHN